MAKSRNHKSTYSERNARARAKGFRSYAHQRAAKNAAKQSLTDEQATVVYQRVKNAPAGYANTVKKGQLALYAGDHEEAERLAQKLPPEYRTIPHDALSAFYYHGGHGLAV